MAWAMWTSLRTKGSYTKKSATTSHALPHLAFKSVLLKTFEGLALLKHGPSVILHGPAIKFLCSNFWPFGLFGLERWQRRSWFGVHLSPWTHQDYTYRCNSPHRTLATRLAEKIIEIHASLGRSKRKKGKGGKQVGPVCLASLCKGHTNLQSSNR